jgi:parafibromin
MASLDSLQCLKDTIIAKVPPVLAKNANPASATDTTESLAEATHIQFNHIPNAHTSFELSSKTRFITDKDAEPIDLRSVYFAWLNRDVGTTEYIAATQTLNEQLALPGAAGGTVVNISFVLKVDLAQWLQGESQGSDHIKPLEADIAGAQAAANIAAGSSGVALGAGAGISAKGAKQADPRLEQIYGMERTIQNRNSIMHGSKPTVNLPLPSIILERYVGRDTILIYSTRISHGSVSSSRSM